MSGLGAWLSDPWQYDFMVRALFVTVVATLVGAVLSTWIVHIGWSLIGDAVSHAVLPGVVLAYMFGVPFAIGALVFGLIAVAAIGGIKATSRIKEDAVIGIVFSTLFALGLVLVSTTSSHVDLSHILFGSILGISDSDAIQVFILALAAGTVIAWKHREFTWYAFDKNHMASLGKSPKFIGALMLSTLAVTAVASLQAVGVVLVVAILITPGATAHLLTNDLRRMLWLAPSIAVVATLVGLYGSYYGDVSSGGAIVLAHGVGFTIAYLVGPFGLRGRRTKSLRKGTP